MFSTLEDLQIAERNFASSVDFIEKTGLNFGVALQGFERELLTLADNDETRQLLIDFCTTLKTLPQQVIRFAHNANDSFAAAANTIRELM